MERTPHFVVVHGSGDSSATWNPLKHDLEAAGCKVTTVDLDYSKNSFDGYNKPLMDIMASLPHNEKVFLLGHSAGGLSVTGASHKFPRKVGLAIYLAATMLKMGYKTDEDVKIGVPESVFPEKETGLLALRSRPGFWSKFITAQFDDCTGEIDKVPRAYIMTIKDTVLKPWQQKTMLERWPCKIYESISDHHPYQHSLFNLLKESIIKEHEEKRKEHLFADIGI